jgi:replicative DNA helicase
VSESFDAPIKSIPSNIEAERAVLGALLIDPDAVTKIASFVRAEDFYRERHAWIFSALIALHEKREPADFVTLVDELERQERLEAIGGPAYITELINSTPTAIYVDFYARIVERTAILRRLIGAAGKIAELAYNEASDVDEVVDRAEQIIFSISESRIHRDLTPIGSIMANVVDTIDFLARNQDTLMGVPTGFVSDLIILAGRPGMGKSSLGMGIAQNAAKRHAARVAVFSLEMSNEQLVQRMLSVESAIDSHRLRLGQVYEEEWPILMEAANTLAATKIFIDDTPGATVMDIRTKSRRLYAEHGLDMIIIDYMQLMSGNSTPGKGENRQQEISYISRSLKELARELNVPVVALSQLSRAVESRTDKRPMLSDLRESGCLAGDTPIYLPAEGRYVPIRSLEGHSGFKVQAVDTETWKLQSVPVSRAFCTGTKPVFRLTTRLGRTIRATGNHKFLTIRGWKRLDELTNEDRIALPRTLPGPEESSMTPDELGLLGHLIGDGCTLPRHVVQYTTKDMDLAQAVFEMAERQFSGAIAPRINPERSWYQVYLSASSPLSRNHRNPIAEWFDTLGIFGLRSFEKYVPEQVFSLSASAIGIFLRHLWATDGCVRMVYGKSPRPAIYYASSSRRLAIDVQNLLLRLGIVSRLSEHPQVGKGRSQFHVNVSGAEDIEKFFETVGVFGQAKTGQRGLIKNHLHGRIPNTNRDVIPFDVWRMYAVPAMKQISKTSRQMQAELGNRYCGTTLYTQNLSRERASRLAQVVKSDALTRLAESDVYWDQIVSIEPDGESDVYDLTVPDLHNFVAGNIVVHNSIEQDADVVLFVYREDYYVEDTDRQNIADVIIAKHRHGSTGTVSLFFRKELTQFRDLEIQRETLDY